ncbi:MAG TPA: hypothetical protein VGL62_03570 [Vicinamibacterales bacterium]|jgi:hypothetical protein
MQLPHTTALIILWLFVIVLGLDLGAGIYEARIVVPLWARGVPETLAAGNPYARVAIDAGMRFWAYMTSTVALVAILALISGFFAPAPQRAWQLAAAVVELGAVAMTLLYFRPTLVRLFMGHGAGLSTAAIQSTVHRWVSLSFVRIVISAVAWCVALCGLKLA